MTDNQQDACDAAEDPAESRDDSTRLTIPKSEKAGDDARDDGKAQEDLDADDLKGFVKDPLEQ